MATKIDKIWFYKERLKENLSDRIWKMGRDSINCIICGQELNPKQDPSPYCCGWKMIDRYSWICHQCLDHYDYTPYVNLAEIDESILWSRSNKEENEKYKKEKIDMLKAMIEEVEKSVQETI